MNSRKRWRAALAGAAATALVAGLLLVQLGGTTSDPAPVTTSASAAASPQSDAAPVTEAQRAEKTAVAAALQLAVAPQQWLYLTDAELEAAVRAVAAPASASRLVADVVSEVGLVRDALRRSAGRIWWLVRPLAWRIEHFGGDRASVSVWTVSVLSASDVAVPQSDWFTSRYDLQWVDGRWLLTATRDEPGPTPLLGGRDEPWQPEPFDESLTGFTRVGAEEAS